MNWKRFFALLLVLALLPALFGNAFAAGPKARTLTDADYAPIDALWAELDAVEQVNIIYSNAAACATVTSMAQLYDRDASHSSAIYVLSTLLSILTMPLMIGLFELLL